MWNGYRENGPLEEGTVTELGGVTFRYWGPGREGIAVDGARDNRIASNWIAANSAGGVFLYTNCGEYVHTDPANWVEHRFGAEDNTHRRQPDHRRRDRRVGRLAHGRERVPDGLQRRAVRERPGAGDHARPGAAHDGPQQRDRRRVLRHPGRGRRDARRVATSSAAPTRRATPSSSGTPFRATVLGHPVLGTVVKDNVSTIVGNAEPVPLGRRRRRPHRPGEHRARRARRRSAARPTSRAVRS